MFRCVSGRQARACKICRATFCGVTPVLAPETEFKGDLGMNAIDEYFEKFRQAGLRVGVCLRPQQITMVGGKPVQGAANNQQAAQVLKDKLAYAKKRWGCTLFYID